MLWWILMSYIAVITTMIAGLLLLTARSLLHTRRAKSLETSSLIREDSAQRKIAP